MRAPLMKRTIERNIRRWLRALPLSVKNKMIDDAAALVFLPPDAATPGGSGGEQAAMEPAYTEGTASAAVLTPGGSEIDDEDEMHLTKDTRDVEYDVRDYLPGVKKEEEEEDQQHQQHGIDQDYVILLGEDTSNNHLEHLPEEIGDCKELSTLN
ncbi:hypothetical protein HCN44_010030 [Aphidius gifuensis]|uniref:Uncharacterized protein n=1 Tax=Aphidius gifuensis TaxID=684658 RepID=A0A834Y8M5_APHGI|nr:hypothetical protein HCN44_010030 [Aphidius gifuensis]